MPTFTPPFRTWLIIHFTACSSSSVSHKGRWRRPKACWRALKAACLSAPLAGPKSSLVTSSDGSRISPPLLLTIFQGFREGVKLVTTNEFIVLIAARLNYKPHATHMYLKCLKDKSRARCARPLQRSAGCWGRVLHAARISPHTPLCANGGQCMPNPGAGAMPAAAPLRLLRFAPKASGSPVILVSSCVRFPCGLQATSTRPLAAPAGW